jgi:hypothetical protein
MNVVRCNGFLSALGREAIDVKTRPLTSPSLSMGLPSPLDCTPAGASLQPVFDARRAVTNYSSAKRRLLLLDLEGTIIEDNHFQNSTLDMDQGVSGSLQKLASDPKNTVYLLSGKATQALAVLMKALPNVGFVYV